MNLTEINTTKIYLNKDDIDNNTLDEIPYAYKDVEFIKNAIGDNVQILKQLKPIINIKGY